MMDGYSGKPTSDIRGFYCPASGRISFLRRDSKTSVTLQVYTGGLTQAGGGPTRIDGVFSEMTDTATLGEYPFQVQALQID